MRAYSLSRQLGDLGNRRGKKGGGLEGRSVRLPVRVGHYEDFTRGVVDTSALIYYCSFIFLCMFLTVRSLESMRWRRA